MLESPTSLDTAQMVVLLVELSTANWIVLLSHVLDLRGGGI